MNTTSRGSPLLDENIFDLPGSPIHFWSSLHAWKIDYPPGFKQYNIWSANRWSHLQDMLSTFQTKPPHCTVTIPMTICEGIRSCFRWAVFVSCKILARRFPRLEKNRIWLKNRSRRDHDRRRRCSFHNLLNLFSLIKFLYYYFSTNRCTEISPEETL